VLCDLDGTLVDSTASVMRNWRRIAAMLGRDEDDPVGDLHGIPGNQVLRRIAPDLDEERVSELNEALVEGEIADTGDVTATKGALLLIETVPPDRWAIVTSGTRRLAVARLRAAGLPVPPIMVTADDVHEGKPNPAPFLLAARHLGVPADRCLAIEDAPAGITAARAAGCATLGVLTTFSALEGDTVDELSDLAVEVTAGGLTVTYPASEAAS